MCAGVTNQAVNAKSFPVAPCAIFGWNRAYPNVLSTRHSQDCLRQSCCRWESGYENVFAACLSHSPTNISPDDCNRKRFRIAKPDRIRIVVQVVVDILMYVCIPAVVSKFDLLRVILLRLVLPGILVLVLVPRTKWCHARNETGYENYKIRSCDIKFRPLRCSYNDRIVLGIFNVMCIRFNWLECFLCICIQCIVEVYDWLCTFKRHLQFVRDLSKKSRKDLIYECHQLKLFLMWLTLWA